MTAPFLTLPVPFSTSSTSSLSTEHVYLSGTVSIGFSFLGYAGNSVTIGDVEFYQVEKTSIDLLQIGPDGGTQASNGVDLGKVDGSISVPNSTENLPPGFVQAKEAE